MGARARIVDSFDDQWTAEPGPLDTPCHVWLRSKHPAGYGQFSANGRHAIKAHRFAWERASGPIPAGLNVLHRCDNRACVNPDHLYLGTQKDNGRDMAVRGRAGARTMPQKILRGEGIGTSKLSADDVRQIRELWASRSLDQGAIARRFNIRQAHVSRIVLGQSWGHVGGPISVSSKGVRLGVCA